MQSYLSPKTEIATSKIHGQGLFAVGKIKKNEIVAIKGGHVLDVKTLYRVEKEIEESYIQIDHDFYIGALTSSEVEANKLFLNHSCDPNLGIMGQITFVAMRHIKPGEELSYDWAMENDEGPGPWKFECSCGQLNCRKFISGNDWKKPDLREKYKGYFSVYIQRKIEEAGDKTPANL